ncbi:hypothetical protein NFI96_024346 [Prochilodus magdalenae]|nr:hypothetical protein NFI96_024346 [Prochilodus magdalenae]
MPAVVLHMERYITLYLITVSGVYADTIGPMEEDTNLVLKETDEVTLKCSYESTSGDIRLYWYRQRVHEAPEYLLYKGAKSLSSLKSTPTDPRLKAETTDTSTGLTIRETSAKTIEPLVGEVQFPEGDHLTLSCNYTSGYGGDNLFWYRQSPGSSPEHLLTVVSGSKAESLGRLKAEVDVENKRVDLKISSAAVSDSVLYYCALQPTVTGNPDTLYRNWFYV